MLIGTIGQAIAIGQAVLSRQRQMNRKDYRLRRAVAAFALTLVVASDALGWGQEGHRVVATIAERHLTAKARERVRQILGPEGSLAAVSTWADEIRPSRPETAPWHYIDIPLNASAIDPARDCPNGDCVTAAITRFVAVLRDNASTPDAKSEALKFVVHFVADLHQPLHCADNHDRGGNDLHVTFFGENVNLHSVWDALLVERIDPNTESYAKRLDAALTDSDIRTFEQGTVEDWALESHAVAQKVAYGTPPSGETLKLGADYFQTAAPAVDLQLQKAGIRLGFILNEALH
jgi:S1/P1 Nuclease